VVFPGQGAIGDCMKHLLALGLVTPLTGMCPDQTVPWDLSRATKPDALQ
jgi:hypothetical protein